MKSLFAVLKNTVELQALIRHKYNSQCSKCCLSGQDVTVTSIQGHTILFPLLMDQYDDVDFALTKCVFQDAAEHGCDHDNTINKIEIRLKV